MTMTFRVFGVLFGNAGSHSCFRFVVVFVLYLTFRIPQPSPVIALPSWKLSVSNKERTKQKTKQKLKLNKMSACEDKSSVP